MKRVSMKGKLQLVLASAGLASCVLTGCDGRSEAKVAVREAGASISGIAAGGGSGSDPGVAASGFTAAKRALDGTPDGTAAEKASVQILKSRAQTGIAAGVGLKVNTLEQQAVAQMTELRGLARAWQALQAEAAAAQSYDPAPELALLVSEEGEIEGFIERAQREKSVIDGKLADLRTQIAQLESQSKAERDKAAELELRASTLSAREAAELAPTIATHAHAADLKLLDVSRLSARANQLETEAREALLTFEKFVQQKALIGVSQAEIRQAAQDAASEASAARAKAAAVAQQVREKANGLIDFRAGRGEGSGLNAQYEEQIAALASAVSSARQAEADMRVNAKFARGTANLALGDVHAKRARSFGALQELMQGLAMMNPPLPDANWFAEQASRAASEVRRAMEAAVEAYGAAADDFGATGGRGASREKLDVVIGRLNEIAGRRDRNAAPATDWESDPIDEPFEDEGMSDEDEG